MTQLLEAKKGTITPEMKEVCKQEHVEEEALLTGVARGEIVIPKNRVRSGVSVRALGKGLRTKVNTNIGTSPDRADVEEEIKKLKVAEKAGTDTIMDLSTAGDLDKIRRAILQGSSLPLGTVPIYQAAVQTIDKRGSVIHDPSTAGLLAASWQRGARVADACSSSGASTKTLLPHGRTRRAFFCARIRCFRVISPQPRTRPKLAKSSCRNSATVFTPRRLRAVRPRVFKSSSSTSDCRKVFGSSSLSVCPSTSFFNAVRDLSRLSYVPTP